MSQFLVNLKWLPRLIWLALTNRVGVRIKDGRECVLVQSVYEFDRRNGIVCVRNDLPPAAPDSTKSTESTAARKSNEWTTPTTDAARKEE